MSEPLNIVMKSTMLTDRYRVIEGMRINGELVKYTVDPDNNSLVTITHNGKVLKLNLNNGTYAHEPARIHGDAGGWRGL